MIRKDKPAFSDVDWEGEEPYKLQEFYGEGDNVVFETQNGIDIAYDFDDNVVMMQTKGFQTSVMNQLYLMKHHIEIYRRMERIREIKRKQWKRSK